MRPQELLAIAFAVLLLAQTAFAAPQNVIVMIADGMGPEYVEAARLYNGGALNFESAPYQGTATTDSLSGLTDSAASATAIATGNKALNFAISQDPAGNPYLTSLEVAKNAGKRTGLITTSFIEDATTAAFGAHADLRFRFDGITNDYLNDSRPNVLLGATQPGDPFTGPGIDPTRAAAAGYAVATTRSELLALDTSTVTHVSGQFDGNLGLDRMVGYEWDQAQGLDNPYDTLPYLSEMTSFGLSVLSQDPDGFFMVVEQENTDFAGHLDASDPERTGRAVFGVLEFANSVQVVLDWIATQADPSETLLIVTADHETGGLQVLADNGPGNLPTVSWSTSNHTPVPVGVYAWGQNGEMLQGSLDNTDLFLPQVLLPEPGLGVLLVLGALVVRRRGSVR
jgi:alkaline phosphatase